MWGTPIWLLRNWGIANMSDYLAYQKVTVGSAVIMLDTRSVFSVKAIVLGPILSMDENAKEWRVRKSDGEKGVLNMRNFVGFAGIEE